MYAVLALAMLLFLSIMLWVGPAHAQWRIVVPEAYRAEEAIRVAVEDLSEACTARGLTLEIISETDDPGAHAIVIGAPEKNAVTRRLRDAGALSPTPTRHAEGYVIATVTVGDTKHLVISGGSVLGDVYGLYWIWDRLRVHGHIPDIDAQREPALDFRYTRVSVRSEADIRRALRYGLNLVFGEDPLRLIPWDAEPEGRENETHRAHTRELVDYAHKLHLKFVTFGSDFTYHPSLLKEFGATLTPADPRFWDAVQAKYRMLFEAVPELDGVNLFTADEQRFWGNYETFDVMHGGDDCDWNLAKRFRTFVTKVWEVVVGEHDKLMFQRTWATNMYEQQAQPEVYQAIFTDDVPTKNLYMVPSFTQNDRWWFQAYNPTINQTPHNTMVVCETMDYHAGAQVFPTYPAAYFQAGLRSMIEVDDSNLKGLSLDMPRTEDWHTRSLTAYTLWRLAWDLRDDPRHIARDYAAIHFGPDAAEGMADLFLQSPVAYKYGLYIEPVAYGEFSSLPHIRVCQFIAEGYPRIDGGKEHIEFLRTIYLRCKPWMAETILYLDHGRETIETMAAQFGDIRAHMADASAQEVAESLELTRLLILTNNLYAKTAFAYFQYREQPSPDGRETLAALHAELRQARDAFAQAPGFDYQLFGVDQLLVNVEQALEDLDQAVQALANAPSTTEIETYVREEQERYAALLEDHPNEATKILHWRGKIDGSDVVRMQGATVSLEHLRWDRPQVERADVLTPLPTTTGTVIPRRIESRPLHPFVLEQPCAENDFSVEIYLTDVPGGADWWEFELYHLPGAPREYGLRDTLRVRR